MHFIGVHSFSLLHCNALKYIKNGNEGYLWHAERSMYILAGSPIVPELSINNGAKCFVYLKLALISYVVS